MAFQKLPDNKGMIYVPDEKPRYRKHPCPDCFSCQWCSNERCLTCRPMICPKGKKNLNCRNETRKATKIEDDSEDKEIP